jgi:beta-glucosidase
MSERFSRFLYQPCIPLGKDGRCATACEEHIELSRKAAADGMILLKNSDNVLPLKKGERVALFGKSAVDYFKGGGGSGDVYTKYVRNILDGLRIKEKEGKLSLFEPLNEFYENHVAKEREWINREAPIAQNFVNNEIPRTDAVRRSLALTEVNFKYQVSEPHIPDDLLLSAAQDTDTAIIVIGRFSGEGWDRSGRKDIRDFYLNDDEKRLVKEVTEHFLKVIVVLNVGGMVDTEWFKDNSKISASILAWQGGTEGGLATADVLCGDVNPSGKLTDTFASSFDDYPSSYNFNESYDYVDYTEDIYVGYRYFETVPKAKEKVNYPFGFGLSYTDFKLSDIKAQDDGQNITVSLKVTNTGELSGKEVVQVYYSAPQGVLGKPQKVLAGFKKTKLLKSGESEDITITFAINDMASYDDVGKLQKSAYLLEQGEYKIYVGTSVRDVTETEYSYTVKEPFIVTEQLVSRCAPKELSERMKSDGSYEALECIPYECEITHQPEITSAPEDICKLEDVSEKATLDEFVAQMTDGELIFLLGGYKNIGVVNTGCFAPLERLGVPPVPTADGPAGVRLFKDTGISTTAWPVATALASTWDTELLYKIGVAGGTEIKENNIGIWLMPGINIHRSPLCGRNFEYFSEDPYLSGMMSAAIVNGVQSVKVACSLKHFVCNNKEVNRRFCDSRVSERALREIYLKGFEICVKKAQPWTVMSSYNLMNGVYTSANPELITGILREEWGFEGLVVSDWFNRAVHSDEVLAGNDIKMPDGNPEELKTALESGKITRGDLQACVKRYIQLILKFD